eukprot:353206-Chlamydomonas_euryale.AAC.17
MHTNTTFACPCPQACPQQPQLPQPAAPRRALLLAAASSAAAVASAAHPLAAHAGLDSYNVTGKDIMEVGAWQLHCLPPPPSAPQWYTPVAAAAECARQNLTNARTGPLGVRSPMHPPAHAPDPVFLLPYVAAILVCPGR